MEELLAEKRIPCSVQVSLEVIGGKWKAVIAFYLLRGTMRFSELRREMPGITQRMLTLQLRELERCGVVERTVYAEVPPRVEYALTPFGESLRPLLAQMYSWGKQYRRRVLALNSPRNARVGERG